MHKGGLHASAMQKNTASYEHIDPALVGNRRRIVVSDQAGRSNVLARLAESGIAVDPADARVQSLVDLVKRREFEGYAYDSAGASFDVMARRALGQIPALFQLQRFSVTDEHRFNADGELVTASEASVKIEVGGDVHHTVADGNGPVNALDRALRKALEPAYPTLRAMHLIDYRVRILKPQDASAAQPRVLIESALIAEPAQNWVTVGVSGNIIEASYLALADSYAYYLTRTPPP